MTIKSGIKAEESFNIDALALAMVEQAKEHLRKEGIEVDKVERLNEDISSEKEMELLENLYDYINRDINALKQDISCNRLTFTLDSDYKEYLWYLDEKKDVAIDMNGKIIENTENLTLGLKNGKSL